MSHSSHSAAAAAPTQGNAGAQNANDGESAAPAGHAHQHSVQQPAAPGETDNIQPEVEDEEDPSSHPSAKAEATNA